MAESLLPLRALLFGTFALARGEEALPLPSSAPARSLLAYLLLNSSQPHSRAALAGRFWPDLPEARARHTLRQALWQIRRALPDLAQTDSEMIGISPGAAVRVDVVEFESLAARSADSGVDALAALRRAAQLYRGELLEGFYDEWALAERERLRERYLQTLERLIAAEKSAGGLPQALEAALALSRADPLRESAHREAMRLYALQDRPEAALKQFDYCRAVLRAELDLAPGEETIALAEEIAARGGIAYAQAPHVLGKTSHAGILLVGRDAEREQLRRRIEAACAGEGGLALIEGEEGVGKTRLAQEAARMAEWRGAKTLWGRCRDLEAASAYGPLIEALDRELACLPDEQRADLLDGVWRQALSPMLPALSDPGGPPAAPPGAIDPAHERTRLFDALARLLANWSVAAPIVLIVEDLHWADDDMLDALAHLARRAAGLRLLVIATLRPEEARDRPGFVTRLRAVQQTRLPLARLAAPEAGELVRRCLGLAAPALLFEARLFHETGGNPLFVLETLRALNEEGLLKQDETGAWNTPWDQTTGDYAELPLPPEVGRAILRRLSRLSAHERDALRAAAVLDSDFTFALLHRTARLSYPDVLRAVNTLRDRELLIEARGSYHFSHEKIRQVAYAEMAPDARQELHRRAAAAIEALHPDRIEALARHFDRAGEAGRAVAHLTKAGERAASVHAHTAALGHYERAIALAEATDAPPDRRFALHAARETALSVLGRREAQADDLRAMAELVAGDPQRLMTVCLRRAWLLAHTGQYDEADAAANEALAIARGRRDTKAQTDALLALGACCNWRGDLARAADHLRSALKLGQQEQDARLEARSVHELAYVLIGLKGYDEARARIEEALALCEATGNQTDQAELLVTLGIIFVEQGQNAEGVACYRHALEACRASGYRFAEARTLGNWANAIYLEGQAGEALKLWDEAAAIFDAIGHTRGVIRMRLNAASIRLSILGEDEAAEREARNALDYYRSTGEIAGEANAGAVLGEIALRRGDLAAARDAMESVAQNMAAAGEYYMQAQAQGILAQLALAEGRPETALAELETGEALCRSLNMSDLAVTLLAQRCEVLLALGRPEAAAQAADEAAARIKPGVGRPYLVHFQRHRALLAAGRAEEARAALEQAHRNLLAFAGGLAPREQQMFLERVPEHRVIVAAWQSTRPRRVSARLPRADAPTGRPLRDDEWIAVVWTVAAPEDEAIPDKVERRRRRLMRLLNEAAVQGAAPTYADLAEALAVGLRTVERDMAELRRQFPHLPPTRKTAG